MVSWTRSGPLEAAAVNPDSIPEPKVNGFFRGVEQLVSGWVLDLDDPRRKHDVEVFIGGKSIGVARADRYDALVQSHHGGDGYYAFAIYHAGELNGEPIEAEAVDTETGTALRSKRPFVTRSSRSGVPLEIHKLTIGKTVELHGRVGAYPWGNDLSLELWSGDERVGPSIPVAGNQKEGLFSAQISGNALRHLLSGEVEVALPGLKEARLAVPLHKSPLLAAVSQHGDKLRVELRGDFEQTGAIAATLRFITDGVAIEQEIAMGSKVTLVRGPADFRLSRGSVELLIADAVVQTRVEWPLLKDVQFREVGQECSPWTVSDNATIEAGFFAFPEGLADKHELSGYLAHVARGSDGGSLRLYQAIDELPESNQNVSIAAFVRTAKKARLAARLRDDEGVISEFSSTSRSSNAWTLLALDLQNHREVVGTLVFEIEVSGRNVTDLDVALGNSRRAQETSADIAGPNLLTNDGMQHWPDGAGVLQHSVRGVACKGWSIFNRGMGSPVFTRAAMHPSDSSLGLAVAAPEVKHYVRVEADFAVSDISGRPLVLRFRAGSPPSAKQLLAHQVEAIPQFAVVDRIFVIRRRRVTTRDSFEEQDEVAATFARKVAISSEIERFEYALTAIEEPEDPCSDDAAEVEESYHLAFDFRHPTVIALFDVEVLSRESVRGHPEAPALKMEDRNIELQIEMLETLAHWRGPTPALPASAGQARHRAPLKWAAGPSGGPVTIVVPVFNALAETLACLDSLNGSTTVPILVRVINDGSDQLVREALEEYSRDKPWVQIHNLTQNRGYTYAADYGIREACTDWVVLLNSDTIVTRGWLEGMLACAHSNSGISFVGPLSNAASYQSVPGLYDASRKWKVNRLPAGITPEDMAEIVRRVSLKDYPEVPLLNGFCTLMKRSMFIELGGLNPTAFPTGYGEENDLCLRAGKAGAKLAVADDVYVYHVKSASFGSARREELTKNGNAALRKLHPEVDISALTARFRDTPALVAIRSAIAEELSKVHGPSEEDDEAEPRPVQPLSVVDQGREPQLQKA